MARYVSVSSLPDITVKRRVYCGVWHKPWTWLKWEQRLIVLGGSLQEMTYVVDPEAKQLDRKGE